MRDLFTLTSPRVKLTQLQLIARIPALAELFLMPFVVIVVFICARPLARLPYFTGILNKPPSLSFLRDQYYFLLARGVDPIAAELPLRLFENLIWILVPILLFRLALSPCLFGVVSWRKIMKAQGGSILKFVIGWLLMAAAVWASTDIRTSSSATGLTSLLEKSPQAYICFEAFVFICGSILFVEEGLALVEVTLIWVRERTSSRPSKDSER